ncbi:hypothetical protein [Asticcacaulis sp.]|uniref:hypothetical protein n=1 Tax=Asticcacaulis sp. TaxID=1872648 RepID=UPI00261C9CB5|nr:hypothetical protein [Asticcacaulis sp.]
MTYPNTEIDKISVELHRLAQAYAEKAEGLASDPYFRDAIMKVGVSNFVWALYHAFDERGRQVLLEELTEQTAAIRRAVEPTELAN